MAQREYLKNQDFLVLDNSIRETSVGQEYGHTPEDKWKVYDQVRKCQMPYIIVADLSSEKETVDDIFVQQLVEKGEDVKNLFVLAPQDPKELIMKEIPTGNEKIILSFPNAID